MPSKLVIEESGDAFGIFSWGPLEKGYAYTFGNALRRILMSSLSGVAITRIRLPEGVSHQFGNLEGVSEDFTDIILNLKEVKFRKKDVEIEAPIEIPIAISGQSTFTAGDLQKFTNDLDILNPDLVICHLDESVSMEMDLFVEEGRGFSLARERNSGEQVIGEVDVDAIFSPVTKVHIVREDKLVGSKTDYEKLVIHITTNGSMSPEEALRESASILRDHFELLCKGKVSVLSEEDKEVENVDQEIENYRKMLQTPVNKLGLSQRIVNSLKSYGVLTLGDIVSIKVSNFMTFRNLGKKSMQELQDLLKSKNLDFGMNIGPKQKK